MNQPNIIYILADDMGYGDLSCLNQGCAFRTPSLDRLAEGGMLFTDAHATSAVCTPSRYSILTGRYNWRSPLKSGVLNGYDAHLIEKGRQTLASMLKERGYRTACVGKWHLGMDWKRLDKETDAFSAGPDIDFGAPVENGPNAFGFDYFYGISASLDMSPYAFIENNRVTELPDHDSPKTELPGMARSGPCAPGFRHEEVLPQITAKALEVITDYQQEPFFLYLPLTAPHTPILPSPEFAGKSGTNAYGDFCLMCDDVVGQIMNKLDELSLSENTLLIFTSDNGCSPAANLEELAAKGHHPSYCFRGHKADIYEGGHRVPLIVRWPNVIKKESRCGQTVCLCDLMATLAEYFESAIPDDMGEDSVSHLCLWRGEDRPVRDHLVHQSIDGSLALRMGRYKLEMCPGSGGWSYPRPGKDCTKELPEYQLYDLEEDIGEKENLAMKLPDLAKEMKLKLRDIVLNGRSTPGAIQKNSGAEVWETVRWLDSCQYAFSDRE